MKNQLLPWPLGQSCALQGVVLAPGAGERLGSPEVKSLLVMPQAALSLPCEDIRVRGTGTGEGRFPMLPLDQGHSTQGSGSLTHFTPAPSRESMRGVLSRKNVLDGLAEGPAVVNLVSLPHLLHALTEQGRHAKLSCQLEGESLGPH